MKAIFLYIGGMVFMEISRTNGKSTAKASITSREPIAVIGIGCRFPGGASGHEKYWELICGGGNAIVDIPSDRWDIRRFYDPDPDKPGKTYVRQGGFLTERIDQFDPMFFGISPREAQTLDPQQRLLLEVAWESLEDAGLQAEALAGSHTGVFVGAFAMDMNVQQSTFFNRDAVSSYTTTGTGMTLLANRLSYVFDFRGPSVAMDTACSSSLVATHYACQSLWHRECTLALAGGVNVMLRPEYFVTMSKGRYLSQQARCMTFDARADGYVRGEGCGLVVLKPLSEALRNGDPIYALIRATGVNQDGQTVGISLPNQEAQEALMADVYRQAGVSPGRVQYIEAHGTGTKAGDPIEARAINHVLSRGRKAGETCIVGSVKTNVGHLEAAAGVAGLIKAVLCLKHKQIPPNLNFQTPNPDIGIEKMQIRVPTKLEAWPVHGGRAYAGVNSFGYGGTNAHVLLEEAPVWKKADRPDKAVENRPLLIPISARGPGARKAVAEIYGEFLTGKGRHISPADFCYTTALRRSHLSDRAAIVAADRESLCEQLRLLAAGETGVIANAVLPKDGRKLAFVYTGMGPQWWAMGRELAAAEPVFRESLTRCNTLFSRLAGWSLLDALGSDATRSRVMETQVAQPANLFVQVALTDLWKSWGIAPDAVVGHSVGEIAAAHAAGVLSLEDAIYLCYHRSRLQQMRAGTGGMLAVGLSVEEIQGFLQDHVRYVSIAAINSASSVTLSGRWDALEQIAGALEEKGVFNRILHVEVPYHSPEMNPIRDALKETLKGLAPNAPQVPLYSTVTGGRLSASKKMGATFWWKNARDPVFFSDAMQALIADGHRIFLEIGPHPVLRNAIGECLKTAGVRGEVVPSLYRDTPEVSRMLQSLGTLYTFGLTPCWENLVPEGAAPVSLPTYPWQKESCWFETEVSRQDRLGQNGHVFLSTDLKLPTPAWEVEANDLFFPYLQDHRIDDAAVFPGAAYVDAGLALHRHLFPQEQFILEDLTFHTMLVLDPKSAAVLHLAYDPDTRVYTIHSRPRKDGATWTHHATGKLLPGSVSRPGTVDLAQLRAQFNDEIQIENFYTALGRSKFYYGPYFQNLKEIHIGPGRVLARIEGHSCLLEPNDYLVHPIVLDASFQLLTLVEDLKISRPWVPVSIEQVNFYHTPPRTCWAYVEIVERSVGFFRGNIQIFDDQGRMAIDIKRMGFQEINAEAAREPVARYRFAWQPADEAPAPAETPQCGTWLVCGDPGFATDAVLHDLTARHIPYVRVSEGDAYAQVSPTHFRVRPDGADFQRFFDERPDVKFETVLYMAGAQNAKIQDAFSDSVRHCAMALALFRALPQTRTGERAAFGLVTSGAQAVLPDDAVPGCEGAPLWGLGRVMRLEYPHIDCRLMDLHGVGDDAHIPLLVEQLLTASPHREMAFRKGRVYLNRLERVPLSSEFADESARQGNTQTPVELHVGSPGRLDSLVFRENKRQAPGPGEVEIRVHASSLNFKDILKAMGTLAASVMENTYVGTALGLECSGVIIAVGEGVKKVRVGDEVIATTRSGSFRSYATVPETYVIRKPSRLSLAEAPIFTVFLTAYYALARVAGLQKGERVLIHNATGGVGLAAIQVAEWIGAEIFATAGTDEKRDYLRAMGIRHIMDSRSLNFADEVRAATSGQGVDVVLNAMFGDALFKSFELLAPYGRFVEIGKKDIAENNGLPMETFNRNATFAAIDLDRIFEQRPDLGQQLFEETFQRFEQGDFKAPPTTTFPAGDVAGAFRYMAQSKHIGKVALIMENQDIDIYPAKKETKAIRADGTYLITGGTRGVGLEMAKWLVSKGARNLVLISKSGPVHDEAKHATMVMKSKGICLKACAVDVTDDSEIQKLFAEIEAEMPPVRGVIHGAMVLQDGLIAGLTAEAFEQVMAPKMQGALNLHRHLANHPLDFFVMCSSISSLFGNMGQANYAAANAFLDSFAHHLRAQGVPAVTVNFGPLSEVGVAARNRDVERLLEAGGIRSIAISGAMDGLEMILEEQPAQIALLDLDWRKWSSMNPGAAQSPMFAHLVEEAKSSNRQGPKLSKREELVYKLAVLAPEERPGYLESAIAHELAKILQLPAAKIAVGQNILNLGIDSLMIVELRSALQGEFGLELSAMDLMRGLSVAQMANLLLNAVVLEIDRVSSETAMSGETLDELLASAMDAMSPEEREALLEVNK